MQAAGRTGATPHGKGMPIHPKNPSAKYALFEKRARICPGRPMKVGRMVQKVGQEGKIEFVRRVCALCGAEGCSYECSGCHQVLCFDTDRSKKVQQALNNRRNKVIAKAPGLSDLPPGSQPPRSKVVSRWRDEGGFRRIQIHPEILLSSLPPKLFYRSSS